MVRTSLPRKCKATRTPSPSQHPSPRTRTKKATRYHKRAAPVEAKEQDKPSPEPKQPAAVPPKEPTSDAPSLAVPSREATSVLANPTRDEDNEDVDVAEIFDFAFSTARDGIKGVLAMKLWEQLTSIIFGLTRRFFVKEATRSTLDVETREWLLRWAPNAEHDLASSRYSTGIFNGWIFRILVDRVFKGHDGELWEGYGPLMGKIEQLAATPPHLLEVYQAPEYFQVSWLNGLDCRQEVSRSIKKRFSYLRPLTASLMSCVTGHNERFTTDHVVAVLTQELGRFFQPKPGDEAHFNERLQDLAKAAVHFDRLYQLSHAYWEIRFTDLATGKAHRFLYRCSHDDPPRDDDVMRVHHSCCFELNEYLGYPVQFVIRPYLCYYKQESRCGAFADDKRFQASPMLVVVEEFERDEYGWPKERKDHGHH